MNYNNNSYILFYLSFFWLKCRLLCSEFENVALLKSYLVFDDLSGKSNTIIFFVLSGLSMLAPFLLSKAGNCEFGFLGPVEICN